MKPLVTAAEVQRIAFGTTHTLREENIPIHTILAAQRRLLRPVVGERVYARLMEESPDDHINLLMESYLKVPLALYVASLLLPSLAVQVGSAGVVRLAGESFEAADERSLCRVVRRLRNDADALLGAATEYLAQNPDLFPEYSASENIKERVSLKGGILL